MGQLKGRTYVNDNFKHLVHGADYNPEQWFDSPETIEEDMLFMKSANLNEFTVGIFAWAFIEPKEGKFDFSLLDDVIARVYENGGRVILATPSGARPRWLAQKYPEVLRVDANGNKMHFGGRHNHCYTSTAYREKVHRIDTMLAVRYGDNPAVIAWHISNEFCGECYCPNCVAAFRRYLRKKFNNDINALNGAYWTSFWSHTYDSFEQIEPPSYLTDFDIHGLAIDWRRFVTLQTTDFMKMEIDAIRAVNDTVPVTTNMMPKYLDLDYGVLADAVDFVSVDSYPDWHSPNHLRVAVDTAFWFDYFRGLKPNKPFYLMESAPGLVNWKPFNKLKRPGMDKLAAIQAIAHGSDSVQYFQWRKSRGCVEKFHGAVVGHGSTDYTRTFTVVRDTGALIKSIDEVAGSFVQSKVAVVLDVENHWAIQNAQGFILKDKGYVETCIDYYQEFWKRGISVDIINAQQDFSGYDLVVAPMLYSMPREIIDKIRDYVSAGGRFYTTYMFAMTDENDLCYTGGFPAEILQEIFGIVNEEIDTLYPEDKGEISMGGKTYSAKDFCEIIESRSAKVLACYAKDFYSGRPALTVNGFGKGKAYYQAFRDDGDFKNEVFAKLIKELKLKTAIPCGHNGLPSGVTAHTRTDGVSTYLFVQNYSEESVTVPLGGEYVDMETYDLQTECALTAYGIKVYKKK